MRDRAWCVEGLPHTIGHDMRTRRLDDPYLVAFGTRLREHRLGAGLTLEDLAERAGVSYRHLSDAEHGLVNPSLLWVRDVASALGAHPGTLLGGQD